MIIFYGVMRRRTYINNRYVLYNGLKARIFYSRNVYGGN